MLGIAALCGVVVLHLAYCFFADYSHRFHVWLTGFAWFVLPGMIPGIVALATANPLRTVGSALCLAPWMLLAIYVDGFAPYTGGGASMIYLAVLFWGTPSALLGALVTGPILRLFGVRIAAIEPAH